MKKLLLFLIVVATTVACSSIRDIGHVNMISNRNIDTNFEYQRLGSYVELTKRQIKRSRNNNIAEAVNSTVQLIPGGEFIMNAKVYLVDGKYFAVEGDVWGSDSGEYRGYALGDRVQWSTLTGKRQGKITGFASKEEFMVQEDGEEYSEKVKVNKLTKVALSIGVKD